MRFFIAFMLVSTPALAQTTPYGPFPNGMRVVSGAPGLLVRNAPNYGQCGNPPRDCTTADSLPSGTYGVVQPDAPVLDASNNWYWTRVAFPTITGWVSAVPPYLNPLTPPQMAPNISFQLVADYNGPALTGAVCLIDGQAFKAIMQLVASTLGQQGTLLCPASIPGIGNHKVVIQAVNSVNTTASTEFQYAVTNSPTGQPPARPMNPRIQ